MHLHPMQHYPSLSMHFYPKFQAQPIKHIRHTLPLLSIPPCKDYEDVKNPKTHKISIKTLEPRETIEGVAKKKKNLKQKKEI